MPIQLPDCAAKYFWGDDLDQLHWESHKSYIIKTLLEKGDKAAISWLFTQTNKQELYQMLASLKLSPKSENFWECYLHE